MSKFIGYSSAMALSFAALASAHANTIAWWHFDECEPGTTAPANTVASDQAPTTYAHVYTIGTANAMSTTVENGGDYLPTYTKPFHGLAVYDPVSGITRTNSAAMKFRVDRGGSTPDSNNGRARFGGGLKFDGGYDLYQSLYGKSALTVEAFVCTTGGVYNTFAPIVGSVGGTSWTSERFAIYMENNGTVAVRLTADKSTDVWYSGNGAGGKYKVNDGAWHHVAFTYDGERVRIYVDYVLDKKSSDDSDRVHSKTGTILAYSNDNATWIGGYAYGDANNGGRKYPGLIDEVRVSDAVLTPDQFLRMQPLDMDPDEIARVSFTPDEYRVLLKRDYADIGDALRPNCQDIAVFRKVSGAGSSVYDTETKAGAIMAAKSETDFWIDDVASLYQETNDVGKANYVQMPFISKLIRGNDGAAASYTTEMFYKTRKTVRGTTDNRQVLMKFGGDGYFNVLFDAISSKMLYVSNTDGVTHYDTASSNADDGKWHHVAVVVDGTAGTVKFYFDYVLAKSRTGSLVDVSTGKSLFFGARDGGTQCFDGWMDDIRVTRRALTPDEFLTTHPVGTGDTSMIALFEQNYDFVSPENDALTVGGIGEARTSGNAPTFVNESRGKLILDGTNGTKVVANAYSVSLNASRVVAPGIPLFEQDSYTVEFWAKFDGIVDGNGPVDAGSTSLAHHVPIIRLSQMESSDYDWYVYRLKDNAGAIQMSIGGQYPGWAIPSNKLVVDGRWHHYAITFEPANEGTNTLVKLFYDYKNVKYGGQSMNGATLGFRLPKRVAGHRLMLGEGSNTHPNIVGKFDAVRVSKGVLDPSQFLGRLGNGMMILVR